MKFVILFCILFALHVCLCDEEDEDEFTKPELDTSKYYRAQVESCPGCSLNRLKEVKTFIYDDVPKYDKVEFKKIHGAPPELVFFDKDDQEFERIKLSDKNREECNLLLLERGFLLKLAARSKAMHEEL